MYTQAGGNGEHVLFYKTRRYSLNFCESRRKFRVGKIMILEKEVYVTLNQFNKDYYEQKGYGVLKFGERIKVKIEDLPPTSGVKIHVICDFCGKIFTKEYRKYLSSQGRVCCAECRNIKVLENTVNKYGVRSTLRVPDIEDKMRKNNLRKFGVEMPLQLKEIREKAKKTMVEKYGHEYTLQIPELREKINITLRQRGEDGVHTSSQQKVLCELFNGELNYPLGPYFIDIFLSEYNVCIEYDGGGHDLCVKIGNISLESFQEKERHRIQYLLNQGKRLIKLKSKTDKLPNQEILEEIKNKCLANIQKTNFYSYNFDDGSESFEW